MRRFIPLLLAAMLSLTSLAAASPDTSVHGSSGTKWALLGLGNKSVKKAPKAPKAQKAKRSKKAGKSSRRAKASR